jgi:pilus assembly protein Flp/PilA
VKGPLKIRDFRRDEKGATAIEYGLICGIICMALLAVFATGGSLENIYDNKVAKVIGALGEDGGDEEGGEE